jgi:phenylacetate-CoA ligase
MTFYERILLKKGWRTDAFWTHPWVYRTFLARIPLFFDTRALMKSQYWPREKLDAFTEMRLRNIARIAAELPLWKTRLDRTGINLDTMTVRDLARMPVMTKSQFFQYEPQEYFNKKRISRTIHDFTSGSTGRPLEHFFDFESELRSFAVCERLFTTAGKETRFPVVSIRARWRMGFAFRKHFMFFIRGYTSVQHRLDDFVRYVQRFRHGFILYGYTSWLVEMARHLQGRSDTLPVRAVIATGEGISTEGRSFIEEAFKTDFYLAYATRELGWLGYECPLKKMHLTEEWAHVEIVDDNDTPLPFGSEGRIVVTTFDNRAMPFIRYDIGDRGVISPIPCACGRTLRTITFLGRTIEYIHVGPDRVVSLLDVAPAFDRFGNAVTQYQIVQNGPLSFTIRVVPGTAFEIKRQGLLEELTRRLHPSARLEWELVGDISPAKSGKAVYFVRAF